MTISPISSLILLLCTLVIPASALASSPLQQQTQGGIEASAANTSATGSIFWNPATIGSMTGNKLHVDAALSWRYGSFERSANGTPSDAARLLSLDAQPNIAVVRQLADTGLRIGLGVGRTYLDRSHWLDEDGAQRWQSVYSGLRTWGITPTVAYEFSDKFSLGVNTQLLRVVAYGYQALDYGPLYEAQYRGVNVPSEAPGNEGRAHGEFRGNANALGAGVTFSPTDSTTIGLSYTGLAEVNIQGDVSVYAPNNALSDVPTGPDGMPNGTPLFSNQEEAGARLQFELPRRVQLGVLQELSSGAQIDLGVDYIQWSTLDAISVDVSAQEVGGITTPDRTIELDLRDVVAARVGFIKPLSADRAFMVQAGFQSSPVRDEHASPLFLYGSSASLGVGFSLPFLTQHSMSVQYTQRVTIPYEDMASIYTPSAAGSYANYTGFLTVALDFDFPNRQLVLPEVQPAPEGATDL